MKASSAFRVYPAPVKPFHLSIPYSEIQAFRRPRIFGETYSVTFLSFPLAESRTMPSSASSVYQKFFPSVFMLYRSDAGVRGAVARACPALSAKKRRSSASALRRFSPVPSSEPEIRIFPGAFPLPFSAKIMVSDQTQLFSLSFSGREKGSFPDSPAQSVRSRPAARTEKSLITELSAGPQKLPAGAGAKMFMRPCISSKERLTYPPGRAAFSPYLTQYWK